MKRFALALAAVLASTGSARAEPEPTWGASAHLRVGSVTAPFHTEALSEVSSEFTQARLMVFDGFYRITGRLWIGGRLPAAPSTVRQPAGSYSDDKAFGNPELYLEDRTLTMPLGGPTVHAAARLGVGIPVAEHGSKSSLLQNRVVALSSALDGWRNPELYEPGVVPITISGRAVIDPKPLGASVAAKLPVMLRISDASLPDESETHAVAIVPHVSARGTWKPVRWFAVDLASHVVVQAVPAVSAPSTSARSGSLQLGLEPGVAFYIRKGLVLDASFSAAVGGPLSGTYGIGLGVRYAR